MQEMSETGGKTWVVTLTSVASFMVALDALVVTTALSTIRIDLGASLEALEWTVNAYNLSFAVLLLTGAALGDRFGRRRIFAAGLTLFVVASAACALAGNIGALIAARSVQGAGAALDRKSTRLNSSHMSISYAVFCLKKKNIEPSRKS